MSEKYKKEDLEKKTKEELIKIIEEQTDEIFMLQFMLDEFENAQSSLSSAVNETLQDYLKQMVIGKTVGEA
tara:strand:- start:257 stop:469 length:213 start_codon:yes stop_codon:yes gene_type:complete